MQTTGGSGNLAPIPEEKSKHAYGNEEDVLGDMKKKSKATFQFNQRAYRKYNSTRTLLERILKSHSEGNRFIKNDDL